MRLSKQRFATGRGAALFILACLCLPVFAANPRSLELAKGWVLIPAKQVSVSGAVLSRTSYTPQAGYPIRHIPATVLEILEDNKVYPNLYFGMNLLTEPPQNLYTKDWWYRTTFTAPEEKVFWLDFRGINYRADIWLNGSLVASKHQVAGMYVNHLFNVTHLIHPGAKNTLAVEVTPERTITGLNGVELADSWFDWIPWKYLSYPGYQGRNGRRDSFVSDRNAGIWKPVFLYATGAVRISHPYAVTRLPLPRTDPARVTVYADLSNAQSTPIQGILYGNISRNGTPTIQFQKQINLQPGETREVRFAPSEYPQLIVRHPDLWWPYTMGAPNLYNLSLSFAVGHRISDRSSILFGIREVTQHRDHDEDPADKRLGGNFYFKINGKNFLVRGAAYSPDLLYRYQPRKEKAEIRYAKNLGLNMLRWESKISSEHIIGLADKAGVPLMFGWMCCKQWEHWSEWDAEDYRVAKESLRSQIYMLRSHPSVFMWSNGSDGLPPPDVRSIYHRVLRRLHWQNAVVDTLGTHARDANGYVIWDGIHMNPYTWRAPSYWFSARYPRAAGSCSEQGDNENVPPLESLKKFIPPNKLWPINQYWYFHAGSIRGNSTLASLREVLNHRYGPSTSAAEFSRKSQVALYESTRAQFEDFAANGWATHKMTIYWMLDTPWPSFFGHLFDYYLKPGGAYFGAQQGLRPLSIVFDYYATGDHTKAYITIVNQTMQEQSGLTARVRIYDSMGRVHFDHTVRNIEVNAQDVKEVMTLPLLPKITPAYFIRCDLLYRTGKKAIENTYWQSKTLDDVGGVKNDKPFLTKQVSWANFTSLNKMPQIPLELSGEVVSEAGAPHIRIRLRNRSNHIAFFERVAVTAGKDGPETLPILYTGNDVTLFPGEATTISSTTLGKMPAHPWLRLEGYNTPKELVRIPEAGSPPD